MSEPKVICAQLHDVQWGDGCTVVSPVNIYRCVIGDHCRIGPFVEIQQDCVICDDVVIGSHTFLAAGTLIGSRTFLGHGVVTCNDRYPIANNRTWVCAPPSIGSDVSIGSGVIILPGVTIGNRAVIGAGMVVTKDIEAGATVRNDLAVSTRQK